MKGKVDVPATLKDTGDATGCSLDMKEENCFGENFDQTTENGDSRVQEKSVKREQGETW